MTESVFFDPKTRAISSTSSPSARSSRSMSSAAGRAALDDANRAFGLALSADEIDYCSMRSARSAATRATSS
jgi:hypothetical protein